MSESDVLHRCMHGWGWSHHGGSCCMGPPAAARRRSPTQLPMNVAFPFCASPPQRLLPACQVSISFLYILSSTALLHDGC